MNKLGNREIRGRAEVMVCRREFPCAERQRLKTEGSAASLPGRRPDATSCVFLLVCVKRFVQQTLGAQVCTVLGNQRETKQASKLVPPSLTRLLLEVTVTQL